MGLISSQPPEEQIPTAELHRPEPRVDAEPEQLSKQELEITTADTKPLPPEMAEEFTAKLKTDEDQMESKVTQTGNTASDEMSRKVSGPLLDLGDFEPSQGAAEEDFVLDIDLDEVEQRAPVARSFGSQVGGQNLSTQDNRQFGMVDRVDSEVKPTVDPMAETQGMVHSRPASQDVAKSDFTEPEIVEAQMRHAPASAPVAETGQVSLQQLSPEAIDAIARRAVEMLSERVVQEIAWEVVPQLAELLIKRQLEEKNS